MAPSALADSSALADPTATGPAEPIEQPPRRRGPSLGARTAQDPGGARLEKRLRPLYHVVVAGLRAAVEKLFLRSIGLSDALIAISTSIYIAPAENAGFMAFLREAPSPVLAQIAELAEPVTEIATYRFRGNQRRLCDALPAAFMEDLTVSCEFAFSLATYNDANYPGATVMNMKPSQGNNEFAILAEQVATEDPDVARDLLRARLPRRASARPATPDRCSRVVA
jgi:hypothetical protein